MSTLAEFKAAERALAMQYRAFEEMKADPVFKKAIEFDAALEDFLTKHKMSRPALYELLALELEPDKKPAQKKAATSATTPAKKPAKKPIVHRRPPTMKIRVFANPHTGKELTVRGNRDGTFNEWNAKYGKDVVRSWLIREEVVPPKTATN
jgi:hypothetical protein